MTNLKIYFVVLIISQLAQAYTPKEGNISALWGPFMSRTDYPGSDLGAKAPYFGGIGLIVQGDLHDTGALEISLFHMQKAYFREQESKTLAEKTEQMHIGLGYRYWATTRFSVSTAFSSSYSMGQPRIIHSDFTPGSEIDTSARDTVEYGFDFSLQSELWSTERYYVIADARYGLSLTNKTNEDGHHYGLLIGLKYLLQEKFPESAK